MVEETEQNIQYILKNGIEFFYHKNFDNAIEWFSNYLKIKFDNETVYNFRGCAYFKKKDFKRAIQDFNSALKIKPDYIEAYCNRGLSFAEDRKYDLALRDLEYAIKLNPKNANKIRIEIDKIRNLKNQDISLIDDDYDKTEWRDDGANKKNNLHQFEKQGIQNYFRENLIDFLTSYILIMICYGAVESLIFFLTKYGMKVDPIRLAELLKFLNISKYVIYLAFSFYYANNLYKNYHPQNYSIWIRGLIVGFLNGLIIGLTWSVLHFIFTLSSGEILNALIDLISFLWKSWKNIILFEMFILGSLGVMWLKDNYADIKKKVKEENFAENKKEKELK